MKHPVKLYISRRFNSYILYLFLIYYYMRKLYHFCLGFPVLICFINYPYAFFIIINMFIKFLVTCLYTCSRSNKSCLCHRKREQKASSQKEWVPRNLHTVCGRWYHNKFSPGCRCRHVYFNLIMWTFIFCTYGCICMFLLLIDTLVVYWVSTHVCCFTCFMWFKFSAEICS